jgi:hypothetical protein
MNRKILYIIATAWVLAFIWQSYAHAGELTDAYLGKWCSAGGVYWRTDNDDGKCGEGSTSKVTITTKGYIDGAEDGAEYCNFISIKSRFDPKDDFSPRTKGNTVIHIVAQCKSLVGDQESKYKKTLELRLHDARSLSIMSRIKNPTLDRGR